jgi:hypothetical protein
VGRCYQVIRVDAKGYAATLGVYRTKPRFRRTLSATRFSGSIDVGR